MAIRVTGLREVIVEFGAAESRALPEVTGVVSKGALNVKKDWQKAWKAARSGGRGRTHIPALYAAVNYDVYTVPGAVRAEIGPDLGRRQGWLGHELEFGSPTNAPHPGGQPALDAEAPRFEAAMVELTRKLLP